jgi:hypothetical protein
VACAVHRTWKPNFKPFSSGVGHALSTNVTLTQLTYITSPEPSYSREPLTDMDHLIGCASSSVRLLALFANPPIANASTSYLRAKFGKLA